jgi:hypothetical protein
MISAHEGDSHSFALHAAARWVHDVQRLDGHVGIDVEDDDAGVHVVGRRLGHARPAVVVCAVAADAQCHGAR